MSHPSMTILYVDQPERSSALYASLFNRQPVESSPTFVMFVLDNHLTFGLWSKDTTLPAPTAAGGGSEVVFQVKDKAEVHQTFADWSARGLRVLQAPVMLDFGFTFVMADPDDHRLRVYAMTRG